MGRPLRMYARGVYHVAGHASDDRSLFIDDIDRRFFLDHLAETVSLLGLRVISYVLMTNHHHLLIDTPDGRIASALHRLHGGYAREHNIRHRRTAHLFCAHPLARRIEDNDDLKWTDRYLARNPVEAGLVPDPFDWFWSSARTHAGLAEPPLPLHDAPLRGAYENSPHWRDRYRAYVAGSTRPRLTTCARDQSARALA
ncbi:MAG TPA: transposase [Gaiellaceae bacterium]|nr:transposase [Gaiellaceae bacterium]